MIDGLKPYPEYRESGVAWLGEVPAHWEVKRAKTLFRRVGRPVEPHHEVVTCFRDGTVTLRRNRRLGGFTESLKEIGYQGVRRGDLVIHAMDAFAGAVGVSDSDGKCTPVYAICEPRQDASPAYYAHVVREMARSQWIVALAKGIRERSTDFRFESFASQPVPVPSPAEQEAIIRFLDHVDRRTRRYIRAKQKLIKLLEEERERVIHQAVTRGLTPDVPLKPSGVDWLGEIPKQWHVERFKDHVAFQEGPGIMAADFRDEGVPLLRISCLAGDVATLDGCNFLDPVMVNRRWSHFSVSPGDYLLSASGSLGTVSRATEAVAGAIPYTGIIRLWPRREGTVLMEYVRYFMASELFAAQVRFMKAGVGIEHFGPKHLNRMFLLVPPLSEQEALVADLERRTASQRAAIGAAKQEIALLREFRTRLIADVVTGKLDVREAAVRLPDLADAEGAQDPLDDDATSLDGDDADAEALDPELQEA